MKLGFEKMNQGGSFEEEMAKYREKLSIEKNTNLSEAMCDIYRELFKEGKVEEEEYLDAIDVINDTKGLDLPEFHAIMKRAVELKDKEAEEKAE